jgi:hypothetical protein
MLLFHGLNPGKTWDQAIGSLGRRGSAVPANAGKPAALPAGVGSGGPHAHLGLCGGRGWGGEVAGAGARRWTAATVVAARAPAKLGAGKLNVRPLELEGDLREG